MKVVVVGNGAREHALERQATRPPMADSVPLSAANSKGQLCGVGRRRLGPRGAGGMDARAAGTAARVYCLLRATNAGSATQGRA